ncbi:helix-turn-helix domain-containing protein [Sporosarcina ureae]|uniref:helix-turn-helix domain-containing protein n=1 Tax=Sporosarcina ureae TaxID=1571 RepID=UPI000A17EBD3|nr:helix-turn-helix transcriptional regulator [Sporosarcina ureae]ARK21871.1 transcriptional regulator [Sporosarcina ureae]
MEIEVAFGSVLKNFRIEKSLSQEALAHLCELDRTYISLMERGKRNPTLNTVFALAKGLDVLPSALVIATQEVLS